jgi:proline iminopeptidase
MKRIHERCAPDEVAARRRGDSFLQLARLGVAAAAVSLASALSGGSALAQSLPLKQLIQVPTADEQREGYVQTGPGVFLYWKQVGSGPPVVVLHGGPGSDHRHLAGLGTLLKDRSLFFYDQRGCGRSTRSAASQPLNWGDHIEDLEAIREALGQDRMVVVGYSFGGLLLQLYAARHPDRIRGMVLIGSPEPEARRIEQIQKTVNARIGEGTREWLGSLQKLGLLQVASDWITSEITRRVWRDAYIHPKHTSKVDFGSIHVCSAANRETLASLGSIAETQSLSRVAAPVLLLYGDYDPIPIESGRRLAAVFPEAELVALDETGHMPWIETPSAFRRALDRFLLRFSR